MNKAEKFYLVFLQKIHHEGIQDLKRTLEWAFQYERRKDKKNSSKYYEKSKKMIDILLQDKKNKKDGETLKQLSLQIEEHIQKVKCGSYAL